MRWVVRAVLVVAGFVVVDWWLRRDLTDDDRAERCGVDGT